jgi:hypothetical protein
MTTMCSMRSSPGIGGDDGGGAAQPAATSPITAPIRIQRA